MKSFPTINPNELCETLWLCNIRTNWSQVMVAVRPINNKEYEISLEEIINVNSYQWLPLSKKYSSWHVFISKDLAQVYLLTVENKWQQQRQFTWWSPQEENLKSVFIDDHWITKLNLKKIEENAILRTKIRTWVKVIKSYNDNPLVDRVLNERYNQQTWQHDRSLVLLLHYIVDSYQWELYYNVIEYTIDGQRYNINQLNQLPKLGQNIEIITNKAIEIINQSPCLKHW